MGEVEGVTPRSLHVAVPALNPGSNFETFLPELLGALANTGWPHRVQVVDDGSRRESRERLQQVCRAAQATRPALLPVLTLPRNQGKGAAIRASWDVATDAAWLAFVDADGSVPAGEVVRLCSIAFASPAPCATVMASRRPSPGRTVHRGWRRKVLGRTFTCLANAVLGLSFHDTQCGFKVVPAVAYARVRQQLQETGFPFDLELIWALQRSGCEILEEPIDWWDRHPSTVRLWRDIPRMLAALHRLRRKDLRARAKGNGRMRNEE